MNRLVLIGNGFDLAHGLKTSYADFVNWYWDKRMIGFNNDYSDVSEDLLCRFRILNDKREERETWSTLAFAHNYFRSFPALGKEYVGKDVIASIIEDTDYFETKFSPLFERIIKGLESKTWAGIEQDYYDLLKEYAFRDSTVNPNEPPIKALNQQLRYLQQLLVEYLTEVDKQGITKNQQIWDKIYAPIKTDDISVAGKKHWREHIDYWMNEGRKDLPLRKEHFGIVPDGYLDDVNEYKENPKPLSYLGDYPLLLRLPGRVMLLDFNYTNTCGIYAKHHAAEHVQIHGNLDDPKSIIFGYGDELDDKFKELKAHKNNACLSHVKSIRYLEAPNYRQMLSFIESEPFQVLIMGHSCGNSDRTLLNTIFEHPNCVSIKPYYYVTDKEKGTDNYIELVQHISRNFNDMKLMRDRVVNKTQCEPLVKE